MTHNGLRQAVTPKQILKRCSGFVTKNLARNNYTSIGDQLEFCWEVPKGHFVVYVGNKRSRYVVPLSLLNRPGFQAVLEEAAEEFGFGYGARIIIPCPEDDFLSRIY